MAGPFHRPPRERADAGLDDDRFWAIVESSPSPDALHAQLAQLGDGDLLAFERRHRQRCDDAYDWGLWGAAYVVAGGCSDDGFMDFRAYLVSLGRTVYERALEDPDSLVDVELDATGETWEDWGSPTMHVVHERTGRWDYSDPSAAQSPEITGIEWREESDDLDRRFPRLTAKYG